MLPPGASMLATKPAATGSVTAEKTTGMPLFSAAAAAPWAAGVAMATMTSTWFATNCWQMVLMVLVSPWPFW